MGQGWLGCGVRGEGKGGTSFDLCSAEAVRLELNRRGLG